MKIATISLLTILVLPFFPSPTFAVDQYSKIQITIENGSLRKNYFEIADAICEENVPNECKVAEIIIKGQNCKNEKSKEECKKSKEIVESPECAAGTVFNGWLESGEMVQLSICADNTGNGRIKTRNSQTAPWTLHFWVEAGKTISVK